MRNPIDAFIQQRLAENAIAPAAEADRRTLIRRLSLDLTGLPPTPEEVEAFASTIRRRRLREARRSAAGLAALRRADGRSSGSTSSGTPTPSAIHGDQNQNVWAYRDCVIDAFNRNKPFDQFTIEQLAGDLLPNPTTEQLIATCFNRLNMVTREGGAQPKEYLAKYTADRVRTVGTTWLGSDVGLLRVPRPQVRPVHSEGLLLASARSSPT